MARVLRTGVAGVWLIHGLYNKLLGGSPRHLAIVQSVPGLAGHAGERVLLAVGMFEVAVAVWVLSRRAPRACAATQTIALLTMNVVELTYARRLLLWPAGLVPVNLLFLAAAWHAADPRLFARLRARLRRHPFPVEAHFDHAIALTYAVPAHMLRPLLPPGLELETIGDDGFVAVALVQTRDLRPTGWPRALGQDFFLAGYRVFTRLRTPDGRRLRGLRILRSDTDRLAMAAGGNLLTHYNYHRCRARVGSDGDELRIVVGTPDGAGDLDVRVGSADVWVRAACPDSVLPPTSPFTSVREARRFAGPLPFTFDYEAETNAIVAIEARRENWKPMPVDVDVRRIGFFDQPAFAGCTPRLAAAFRVDDVEYHWNRGIALSERAKRVSHANGRRAGEAARERACGGAGGRSPRQYMRGVKQIVRFNWPFYAAAIVVASALPVAASRVPLPLAVRALVYAATALVLMWIAASLAASWIVYDCSRLMEWDWVLQALGFSPKSWINLHAGLDESTPALRAIFKDATGRVFDIFDAGEMTEPSILRARKLARNQVAAEHADFRHLPLPSGTIDVATLLLSAHELRSEGARSALFTELRRVLGPGGRVIVAEHLRDWANVLAFGPGALHFHSRRTWALCFSRHRFDIHREFSITPFVRVFVLRRLT